MIRTRWLLQLRLVALALTCATASLAQDAAPLRVIRSSPTGDASPLAQILVTFDRPVAGSLDRIVDAASVLTVEPAIAGKLEWRDPVTIRLTPTDPLLPGRTYTVSISNSFHAMDGAALAQPYRFTFRAAGPKLDPRAAVAQEIP
jgi:hypothetical protein